MGIKQSTRRPYAERREPYLLVFLVSFAILMVVILPVMIFTGGYFIYYGDFNSQQLPFYWLAHDAVQNGAFGWNWMTDLGANFIGSYSFYLLGSPFFWLTVPFPQEWVLYMIPYLLGLKHAIAALTAYAYIRRFVRSKPASFIGALLYAFSGFQLYNIFFNHFHDVTAFFPLLLIAMEQRVNENRRGVFALAVAFMGILNYYFFTGQAVFAVIYYIVRCTNKDFHADVRKFFSIALEAVIGVMIAAFMLLPSALAILDNYRIKTRLYGNDLVAYSDRVRVWHIIQSFFMLPDVPARPNLFRTDYGKWASIGGYLPMFSMAGVISFMMQKRKHWATRLTAVCIICAFIPVLNSMFYTFNGSYYARWFYMPILIMAMMTAYALDNREIKWKNGIITCAVMLLGFAAISLLPRKEDDGKIVWFDFAKYTWYHWLTLGLCAVMLYFAILVLQMRKKGHHRMFRSYSVALTIISCLCSACTIVYFGIGLGVYPTSYVNTMIKGGAEIHLEDEENQFYRVDISQDYDNYPMVWGYPNMRCFHSIVPTSIMDFYEAVGVTRDVASRPETKNYALRELFSVKYYFDKVDGEDLADYPYAIEDMPSFKYRDKANGFYIYENEAYIPMGIAYDTVVSMEDIKDLTAMQKQNLMLRALIMTPEQVEACKDKMTKMTDPEEMVISDKEFEEYAPTRVGDACDLFDYDSYGFRASIKLDAPKMIYFSVPYESGWTATVNGQPAQIEKVNYGFMAVACEEGDNEIRFSYATPGLREGLIIAACGVGALLLYLLWMCVIRRGDKVKWAKQKHYYDYADGSFSEHLRYMQHSVMRNGTAMAYEPPAPLYDDEPVPDADDADPAEWAPDPEPDADAEGDVPDAAEDDAPENSRKQNADDILRELLGGSAQTGGSRFAEPDEEETDDGTGE